MENKKNFDRSLLRLLLLGLFCILRCGASEIQLKSPLTTIVTAQQSLSEEATSIDVLCHIPEDAPADLGMGAWMQDSDGIWFQSVRPGPCKGTVRYSFDCTPAAGWEASGHTAVWNSVQRTHMTAYGVFFFSSQASQALIHIEELLTDKEQSEETIPSYQITALTLPDKGQTGQRLVYRCLPDPMPVDVFDPDVFYLDLVFTTPDGKEERVPGFYRQPYSFVDRGDSETGLPQQQAFFEIRYRPRQPGLYSCVMEASWDAQEELLRLDMPSVAVAGEEWDEYIRVDTRDSRYFATGVNQERMYWPVGVNMNSAHDKLSIERYHTKKTVNRGLLNYHAFFERYAAAGVNAAEVWMSSWNFALEWSNQWPHQFGLGAYSSYHAERLDALLDDAAAHDMRILLNIDNHGKAQDSSEESEWRSNPLHQRNGGPLVSPYAVFSHPEALRHQENLRRYIIARYADHPAVLGWKLWSEVDLTQLGLSSIRGRRHSVSTIAGWHKKAAKRWHALDIYNHPVCTHFATTFKWAHPRVAGIDELDFTTLDAYHHWHRERNRTSSPTLFADLLYNSLFDRSRGAAQYDKPVMITEYGGNNGTFLTQRMLMEHESSAWAALVCGHGAAPMLWWFEWVDQHDYWKPYTAITAFIKNEDFRHAKGRSVGLKVQHQRKHWARCLLSPGCMWGYIQDHHWGASGDDILETTGANIRIGKKVREGAMTIEWWNANTGEIIGTESFTHVGGELTKNIPDFHKQIAFKLRRN